MLSERQFRQAVAECGGLSVLAAALGVSPETLANWKSRGVPANRARAFAEITGIPVKMLRADWRDYWPELETRSAAL